MRILSVVILMALLATLGLLACVPVTPAPAVTPTPAVTPAATPAFTSPPTPPMPTPRPGATPVSSTTNNYNIFFGGPRVPLDLKKGDIVVLSLKLIGDGMMVSVDDPARGVALMPQGISKGGGGKFSFQAQQDGTYSILLDGGIEAAIGGGFFFCTLTVDVYR